MLTIITEEGPPGWGAASVAAAAEGLVMRGDVRVGRVAADGAAAAMREVSSGYALHVPATERVTGEFLAAAVERLNRADPPDVLAGRSRWIDVSGQVVFEARPPEPFTLGQLLRLRTRWFDGRCALSAGTVVRGSDGTGAGSSREGKGYDAGVFGMLIGAAARGARMEAVNLVAGEARVAPVRPDDANLRTVRAMLPVCQWAFDAAPERLGEDAGAARDEVGAVEERARFAEVVCGRWGEPHSDPVAPSHDVAARGTQGLQSLGSAQAPPTRGTSDEDAPGAYADLAAEDGEGWLGLACAMALPHLRLAAAAARRELPRVRRARVLWVCRNSGAGAEAFLTSLGARRLEATVAVHGAAMRGRAERRLASLRSWSRTIRIVALDDAADRDRFDLIACENVLTTAPRPDDQLRGWADLLSPHGLLVLAGEPREPAMLGAYIRALTRRVCDQITLRTDMHLDPEADAHLRVMVGEEERAPGLWARAHPHARGVDGAAVIARLGFESLILREYGSVWFHPLTPFPYVEGSGVGQEDAWVVGVWKRSEDGHSRSALS